MRILAIDPGEVHCGMAYFEDGADPSGPTGYAWHCVWSHEEPPDECVMTAYRLMTEDGLDVLIVERFQLYPWKSQQQSFSQMKTVEVIGVLRYIWKRAVALGEQQGDLPKTKWEEPQASVLKAARAILRAKGVQRIPSASDHVRDAQVHGWRYILKELEGEEIE